MLVIELRLVKLFLTLGLNSKSLAELLYCTGVQGMLVVHWRDIA